MKTKDLALLACIAATPALAEGESRGMDAHVHGVSVVKLAVDGATVQMNLHAPGMDIVGFEYSANSDEEKDAVEQALRTMLVPENVVLFPKEAECRIKEVLVHLHAEDHHDDEEDAHDHADKHEHSDDHDDHDEHHDHDHDTEKKADAHEEKEGHSEFHARYILGCAHPEALSSIDFPFFDNFENAREIELQYVTEKSARAAEIKRGAANIKLD